MVTPAISVIVPVYNTQRDLLARCLNSILNQTFSSFELIIIDDGSKTQTGAFCDEYLKDERVRVYHTENHGLGPARNYGISKASGVWIAFVDSDDWCDPEYLMVFDSDNNSDADLITQGYVREEGEVELGRRRVSGERCHKDRITEFYLKNDLINFSSACCRLFKRSIIQDNGLHYPYEFSYGEDSAFFPKYLQHCSIVVGIAEEHYHYMFYSNSMANSRHGTGPLFAFIKDSTVSIKPLVDRDSYGKQIGAIHNRKSVALAMRAYVNMYVLKYDKDRKLELIKHFKDEVRPLLNGKNLPFKESVFWKMSGLPAKLQLSVLNLFWRMGIIKA